VTRWYLDHYYATDADIGGARMFCDPLRVGAFAADAEALGSGDPDALMRVLVATTMFQRRQDAQILRVLRGISEQDAAELTSLTSLTHLAATSGCATLTSNRKLLDTCDLGKDPVTRLGTCSFNAHLNCHLKRHTVLLKRYGHFGKMPTSIALVVREATGGDLRDLFRATLARYQDPGERAFALRDELSSAWRVSDKIAAMFLSAVSNPDLSPGLTPWEAGVDWTQFVVIDSNVDLFLRSVSYPGPWTYEARRRFVRALARRVRLDELRPGLRRYNPRIVQQALYVFMSGTNRRLVPTDCGASDPPKCLECPRALSSRCPRRRV